MALQHHCTDTFANFMRKEEAVSKIAVRLGCTWVRYRLMYRSSVEPKGGTHSTTHQPRAVSPALTPLP